MTKSIMDYIFKWLAIKFLSRENQADAGVVVRDPAPAPPTPHRRMSRRSHRPTRSSSNRLTHHDHPSAEGSGRPNRQAEHAFLYQQDAPSCSRLRLDHGGANGACYKCLNCGSTSGCS